MKKIFITGGAGFIGHTLAKQLLKNGYSVKTFDIVEPTETICEHEVSTIMYQEELFNAMKGCDYVVHLAAMLGVRRTEQKRMGCLDINIQGTKNVFDASVKTGIKKIIFCSSSEVYGESHINPIKESGPVSPKSVYAVSKLAGEEYLKAQHQMYGIAYSIVRLFNVYGPGQVAEFVMPRFIKTVLENKQPVIYGSGEQRRCFCYVDDAATGIELALSKPEANGEIFNIGNDKTEISMADLARKVVSLSGKDIEPRFIAIEESDRSVNREIMERVPDITKARKVLGYEPRVSLDDGILRIIEKGNIKDSWDAF